MVHRFLIRMHLAEALEAEYLNAVAGASPSSLSRGQTPRWNEVSRSIDTLSEENVRLEAELKDKERPLAGPHRRPPLRH
jgi:hypothetical protein